MTAIYGGRVRLAGLATILVLLGVVGVEAQPAGADTGAWTATGSLTTGRQTFTLTTLPDGRALAAGGDTVSSEVYDEGAGTWSPGASLGQPRRAAAAVRLQNGKVLVTGGLGSAFPLASAELYDPVANTWSSCSSAGTPGGDCPGAMTTARFGHTATLLGDGKVLLVGGNSSGSGAEVYDPATGTFSATPQAPSANRTNHTATRLGNGKVLVAGGRLASGITASSELYDPATGGWSTAGSIPGPGSVSSPVGDGERSDHTATLLGNGKVLVTGGDRPDGEPPHRLAALYDPASGWSAGPSMNDGRYDHTATLLAGPACAAASPSACGKVLLAGGFGTTPSQAERIGSVELYDPAANSFRRTSFLRTPRYQHEAALLGSGKVLVAGGASPSTSAEIYDPSGRLPTVPSVTSISRRRGPAATGGTRVVIRGSGFTAASDVLFGSTPASSIKIDSDTQITVLSPARAAGTVHVTVVNSRGGSAPVAADLFTLLASVGGRWESTNPMINGRVAHTVTSLPSGKVLAAGSELDAGAGESRSSAELYDPVSSTWSAAADMNVQREEHTATLLADGKVLVAGGSKGPEGNLTASPPDGPQGSTELYDPSQDTWRSCGPTDPPGTDCPGPLVQRRSEHAAVRLPNGKVLVAGGHSGENLGCEICSFNRIPLASAELYDPATGTWSTTGPMGAARDRPTLTLLRSGKVLVVGGTFEGRPLETAEVYDPASGGWTPTANRLALGRLGHTSTLLPDGRVLVAGGGNGVDGRFSAEIYNPADNRWAVAGELLNGRARHTATLLGNGKVLLVGGETRAAGTAEIYDGAADGGRGLSNPTDPPETPHTRHGAVLLASGPASICGENCGEVLVTGGDRPGDNASISGNRTTELFTPSPVPPRPPVITPPPPPVAPPSPGAGFAGCPASAANVIRGSAAGGRITGTPRADRIFGGTGDDIVDALAGDDCVSLGTGADRGQGGTGNDLILGGLGADRIAGSSGNDRLRGGGGDDRIGAGRGNDRAFGGQGDDLIRGSFGNDRIHGVSGADRLIGSRGRDRINGGSGNDRIFAGSSNDRVNGDRGNDRINGGSGTDVLRGNSGNDRIKGSTGRDFLSGGSGRDRLNSRDGRRDRVNCGRGRDRVIADRSDRVARNCERVSRRG